MSKVQIINPKVCEDNTKRKERENEKNKLWITTPRVINIYLNKQTANIETSQPHFEKFQLFSKFIKNVGSIVFWVTAFAAN